jgi:hypothetical protein
VVLVPEHTSGWALFRMESLSWLNMAISVVLLASAALVTLPAWTFWTTVVVAATVIVLEIFDEWAERRDLAEEVVGPESVVLVAALWLIGTVLVTGGPAWFVALAAIGGAVIAAGAAMNAIEAYRMDPTARGEEP